MKIKIISVFLFAMGCFSLMSLSQTSKATTSNTKKSITMQQVFIDRFIVPAAAKEEFVHRMKINRTFIKTLNGFISDVVYEQTNEDGSFNFVTTAFWKDAAAIKAAKEEVFKLYKEQGFDPAAFYKRLEIKMERGVYEKFEN